MANKTTPYLTSHTSFSLLNLLLNLYLDVFPNPLGLKFL